SPIYTKVRDEIPTYFADGSTVDDCLMADGCTVYGAVAKSILFRGSVIEHGAAVENSIIMQGSRIGKNTRLSYVILDKNVTVSDGTVLCGTAEHPVIIGKGETV
ncbi:MAG: glucose-1-phosphate adenylyltransferase subunit GlgD, partial [Oscillospiraceae bacterium]|nr:glucose-1-phosphate adenylyltransferase subunit GlgD [Candidatus Equicaccousia limihippi]